MRIGLRGAVVATVVASSVLIAACGGGADDDSGDGSGKATQGGSITMSQTSQPDFMDPALTYTSTSTTTRASASNKAGRWPRPDLDRAGRG